MFYKFPAILALAKEDSKKCVEPKLHELVGELMALDRESLTGFKVAFWADGWKLACEVADTMRKHRSHTQTGLEFQQVCVT